MSDDNIHDHENADNAVLLSDCRVDAEFGLEAFCFIATSFGSPGSTTKTKLLFMDHGIEATDTADIAVSGSTVDSGHSSASYALALWFPWIQHYCRQSHCYGTAGFWSSPSCPPAQIAFFSIQ